MHIFDNPWQFYIIKQRKQSNQINKKNISLSTYSITHESFMLLNKEAVKPNQYTNISLSTYSITHENFMLLNKGNSQTKSINKHLTIHIFDNPRKFYVVKQMKQSNQINKQTSHYPHIR